MPTINGKSTPATRRRATGFPVEYTDEARARLLAPISINRIGGRSWGGAFPTSRDIGIGRKQSGDRYGYVTDWADLDA